MTLPLLFSIDDAYVPQLKTTLYSILAHTDKQIDIYVMQKEKLSRTQEVIEFCNKYNVGYNPIIMTDKTFESAPVSKRYPEEIYYRLLAHDYLPEKLSRILYLDADILCLNDISPLFELELGDNYFAAASHSQLTELSVKINQARLQNFQSEGYFNSGVLLINLEQTRQHIVRDDITDLISKYGVFLFLPDQDALNKLYGLNILSLDDEVYNYDSRNYMKYQILSKGVCDLQWVMENTVFIHYCGKDKPWNEKYPDIFSSLYFNYAQNSDKMRKVEGELI